MKFTKMHGLGNDYIYVEGFTQPLDDLDAPALCRRMSDRHKGIGADGLILIRPPSPGAAADVRMEMYNADGSRGEMCGNGIRCVAKYVLERGLAKPQASGLKPQASLRVETDRGVLDLTCHRSPDGKIDRVRVNMGEPILKPTDIPVTMDGPRCVRQPLSVGEEQYEMTCVSMGNPHAVFYLPSLEAMDLARLGPIIERHPVFPNRINVHVAEAVSRCEVTMRTWERGTGLTQACGTGACSVLVAGVLEGRLERSALIHLPGGDLEIEWDEATNSVFKTGPATEVFNGEWRIQEV
ncbi:MAG TPA: diaminopimelate epimerase [Phycisphaerae bacterium]|nr:diaminopimelate epimerase [Phycisphaerae bacterium]